MAITNAEAHRIARQHGASGPLYRMVKHLAALVFRVVWGVTAAGTEHVPKQGPAVIVPNHKSFWDPFVVAIMLGRPVHFMGKAEHFDGPLAKLFLRLGAFPVRRGASDTEALDTARAILRRGDVLALFPEGTRVRIAGLGTPKRGAARLAIEAGAPLVPTTITGTEKRRWPFPRRVRLVFGTPVSVDGLSATREGASAAIDAAWPQVTDEYTRWQNRPTLLAAGLTAVGPGAWAVKRKRGLPRPRRARPFRQHRRTNSPAAPDQPSYYRLVKSTRAVIGVTLGLMTHPHRPPRRLASSPFQPEPEPIIERYALGDRVAHDVYGVGHVVQLEAGAVTVDFRSQRVRVTSPFPKMSKL